MDIGNDFKSFLPSVRIRSLNLYSASSVNLRGLSNLNVLRNNSCIGLSPFRSLVIRKYSYTFISSEYVLMFLSAIPRGVTIVFIYVAGK